MTGLRQRGKSTLWSTTSRPTDSIRRDVQDAARLIDREAECPRALRVDRAARGYDDFFNNLLGRQYAVQALGKVADIMRYAGLVFTGNCLGPHAPRQTPPWRGSPIYPWEIVLG